MPKPPRHVTDDLRRRLEEIERRLGGDDAATLRELLREVRQVRDEVRGLQSAERSDNVQEMTSAQAVVARRGRAIGAARARDSEDPRRQAIAATKWGSQRKYAKDRLGISASALTGYLDGAYPIPRKHAAKVEADCGLPADTRTWPKGIVD
jgi:hypothetical protein